MSTTVAKTLDLKGLSCPLPIVKTAQAIKRLAPGELLEALAAERARLRAVLDNIPAGVLLADGALSSSTSAAALAWAASA